MPAYQLNTARLALLAASNSLTQGNGQGEAAYIPITQNGWTAIALLLLVVNLLAMPILSILLWQRRKIFPLNSTPSFLTISTQVGVALYVSSLLQDMVSQNPTICGLNFFVSYFSLFPFFVGTMLQLFRNWFVYNFQKSCATGKSNFFTNHAYLISEKSLGMLLAAFGGLFALLPIIQLANHSSGLGKPINYETLVDATTGATERPCLKRYASEDGLQYFFSALIIVLNLIFAFLMRNIDDAFNLRENWKKILYWFTMGSPLKLLSGIAGGVKGGAQEQAYAMGNLAFVAATMIYLWYTCIIPLRRSYILQKRGGESRVLPSAEEEEDDLIDEPQERKAVGEQDHPHKIRNDHVIMRTVSSVKDLKPMLQSRKMLEKFKGYLVKEFCVENALFLEQLIRLREAETSLEEKIQIMHHLRLNFFLIGSSFEINIMSKQKEHVTQALTKVQANGEGLQECMEAITLAEEEVLRTSLDSWNRFVREYNQLGFLRARSGSTSSMASFTSAGLNR